MARTERSIVSDPGGTRSIDFKSLLYQLATLGRWNQARLDSNRRILVVSQTLLPLNHEKVDSIGSCTRIFGLQDRYLPVGRWTRVVHHHRAEAVGLEPTSGSTPPPVFKTGSSSSRMTSVRQIAGVGIEPTPPGSEPSIATSSDYPAMNVRRMTRRSAKVRKVRGAGFEPADSASKAGSARKRDGWDSNPARVLNKHLLCR